MDNLLIVGICVVAWLAAVILIVLFFMGAYANETPILIGLGNHIQEIKIDREWRQIKKLHPDADGITFFIPYEDSRIDNLEKISQALEDMKGDQDE